MISVPSTTLRRSIAMLRALSSRVSRRPATREPRRPEVRRTTGRVTSISWMRTSPVSRLSSEMPMRSSLAVSRLSRGSSGSDRRISLADTFRLGHSETFEAPSTRSW